MLLLRCNFKVECGFGPYQSRPVLRRENCIAASDLTSHDPPGREEVCRSSLLTKEIKTK